VTLGLVLSGGGANGAYEVGVLQAMAEAGLRPTIVSGTSAGALNAAGLGVGFSPDELADIWTGIRSKDVYRARYDLWRLIRPQGLFGGGNLGQRLLSTIGWVHLLDTAPLRRTLVRALGGERLALRDGLVVAVSAVEKATGELVRFTNRLPAPHRRNPRYRQVDLHVDHLMASAAIPLAFPAAAVGEERFWDGGLLANTPLAPALAYEPDEVVVVTTATLVRPAARPRNLGETISLLINNVLAHSLRADLETAKAINRLCELDPDIPDRRWVDLLVVEPTGLDLGNGLDFSPALARRRIALGYEQGARKLDEWLRAGRLTAAP
jgi:NTE family protein